MKARNASRLASLHTLVNAFNLGLSDSGSFPYSTGGSQLTNGAWDCVSATCYADWAYMGRNATVDSFLSSSLPSKPADPSDGTRGYGGFAYANPVDYTSPKGAYLNILLEPGGPVRQDLFMELLVTAVIIIHSVFCI